MPASKHEVLKKKKWITARRRLDTKNFLIVQEESGPRTRQWTLQLKEARLSFLEMALRLDNVETHA
jgi:hypothetical protein